MVYIESHQELANHPKLLKAALTLGVSRVTMVGHMHLLWWWAMSYAPDGDVDDFDAADIAIGADWEGDPQEFCDALLDCGPGNLAGFLEVVDGRMVLHDWEQYGGKLHERRQADAERKRAARRSRKSPRTSTGTSEGRPTDVQQTEEFSDDVRRATREFAKMIQENGHPCPSKGSKANRTWLVEMRRLLELGPPGDTAVPPPTVEEVLAVARWATEDSFWKSNVKSVPKFRQQWSTLALQAAERGRRSGGQAATGMDAVAAYAARIGEDQ